MNDPEPRIRVLVGKLVDGQDCVTSIVEMGQLPQLTPLGWMFICADPEDLSGYLAWLYKREIDS